MNIEQNKAEYQIDKVLNSEDLNSFDLIGIVKRNYKLIFGLTFSSIVLSVLYSLSIKPTFEGDFQIVLQEKDNKSILKSEFSYLMRGGGGKSDTKTEVAILKSPLVMNSVFEFYKDLASQNNVNADDLPFKKWIKNNFKIALIKNTTILNVAYRSSNKESILPILKKLSKEYQIYSGRSRNLQIANMIQYLEEQIALKKEKSEISMTNLQQFSLDNSIGSFDGMIPELDIDGTTSESNASDNLSSERYKEQFATLNNLESELVLQSAFYKDNSENIRILKKQIQKLKESLKRPQKILIKYQDLAREANRDMTSLIKLENQLDIAKLDQAKKSTPWELISEPYVSDVQVAPEKKAIVRFWTLIGLLSGILASIVIDSKDNFLYSEDEFKKLLPIKFLKSLKAKDLKDENFNLADNLNNYFENLSEKKLFFLYLNEESKVFYQKLINSIIATKIKKEIKLTNKFSELSESSKNFLLIKADSLNKAQIKDLIEDIQLSKKTISGWIYIG